MGTTLTLAYVLNQDLYVAHAGDSRCYLCREGKLFRLTQDHTLVAELVRAGGLSPKQAARHPWRHTVTNAIGGASPEISVEVHKARLEAGDRLLLCSDGLTEMVPESMIAHVLDTETDPEQACGRFIAYANKAGGHDNITTIVACFDDRSV
jgi:protein phosphatase